MNEIGMFDFSLAQAAAIGIIGVRMVQQQFMSLVFWRLNCLVQLRWLLILYGLVPLIQPPIMRALTSRHERKIRMQSIREVSQLRRCFFLSCCYCLWH